MLRNAHSFMIVARTLAGRIPLSATGINCVINTCVAKMASHAIFQYNVLAIDDTHNTWTNMIVKMNIPRFLGSSDDKEKISIARPEGPPLRGFRFGPRDKI